MVICLKPPKTQEEKLGILLRHQRAQNFIIAEKLITKLLPFPPVLWSEVVHCEEIGRGIWIAEGRVEIDSHTGQKSFPDWKAVFMPQTSRPFYLSVGSKKEGDYDAALARAGVPASQPGNP